MATFIKIGPKTAVAILIGAGVIVAFTVAPDASSQLVDGLLSWVQGVVP